MITFASSWSVENFLALKLPLLPGIQVGCLGPITAKTLREAGLKVDLESPAADLDAFADAVCKHLRRKP